MDKEDIGAVKVVFPTEWDDKRIPPAKIIAVYGNGRWRKKTINLWLRDLDGSLSSEGVAHALNERFGGKWSFHERAGINTEIWVKGILP
jgi:hypothetical protein